MSELCVVYGCIHGAHGSTSTWYDLYSRNAEAIARLPTEDVSPELTRSLFAVPEEPLGPGFFRRQIIHFGASYNHLAEEWHQWLDKFEALLRELYWFEAHVHADLGLHGRYHYRWTLPDGNEVPFYADPPATVATWSFEGGPRSFA
jgi:hypothetical protein